MSFRPEDRRNQYKRIIDPRSCQRRREFETIELQKQGRASALQKRRQGQANLKSAIKNKLDQLPEVISGVFSDDLDLQLEKTTQFREWHSAENLAPMESIKSVVPRFVEFLMKEESPQLQLEAAWSLTNIASGTSENTKIVIDSGAIPIFLGLLNSPRLDVREQAVWALGNIAADSPSYRDTILENNGLVLLLQLFEHGKSSTLKIATWVLSNLCGGKPLPAFHLTQPALPTLELLIRDSTDVEVLTDACWALSNLAEGTHDDKQTVIDAGVCPKLVELLRFCNPSVILPALRTIGNIVTGNEEQTQLMIDLEVLPRLFCLLTNKYETSIKREACWTISNITAGNSVQIQAVLDANLIDTLVNLVLQNVEFDIQKEAAWAISNATCAVDHILTKNLVHQGCIKPLCNLLACHDPGIVRACLKALNNILKVGEQLKSVGGVNPYVQSIKDNQGLTHINSLQNHENTEIRKAATMILGICMVFDVE